MKWIGTFSNWMPCNSHIRILFISSLVIYPILSCDLATAEQINGFCIFPVFAWSAWKALRTPFTFFCVNPSAKQAEPFTFVLERAVPELNIPFVSAFRKAILNVFHGLVEVFFQSGAQIRNFILKFAEFFAQKWLSLVIKLYVVEPRRLRLLW